jgi:hypothetical protein
MIGSYHVSKQGMGRPGKIAVKYHRTVEVEVTKLKRLTQGIPGVEKNITPILAFIDILKFHLGDLKDKE